MARGTPSMVALLGLLAVAGYQNRDKIAEMLNSFKNKGPTGDPLQDGARNVLGKLGDVAGNAGNILNEGLGGLVDQFKQSGHGDLAELHGSEKARISRSRRASSKRRSAPTC